MSDKRKPTILIVDDNADNITLYNKILKNEYRIKVATNGVVATRLAKRTLPDIILMDVMMPLMNGYETCRRLKKIEKLRDVSVLFLTAKAGEEDEKKGLILGAADYMVKPISPSILKARINTHLALKKSRDVLEKQNHFLDDEIQRRTKDISIVQEASIMAMAALAEIRDNETGRHLQRTKLYIKELVEYIGQFEKFKKELSPIKTKLIILSSPLHDIGKVGIPDNILLKPGPLTKEEHDIMKKHTILGRNVIMRVEKLIGGVETFLSCARGIAYSHHEKWDGSGYPQGLSGIDIPLAARLMAIVDAYDAITSKRVYKEAISHEKAVSIITADSGKHFDPDVVIAFLALKEQFRSISEKQPDLAKDKIKGICEGTLKKPGKIPINII